MLIPASKRTVIIRTNLVRVMSGHSTKALLWLFQKGNWKWAVVHTFRCQSAERPQQLSKIQVVLARNCLRFLTTQHGHHRDKRVLDELLYGLDALGHVGRTTKIPLHHELRRTFCSAASKLVQISRRRPCWNCRPSSCQDSRRHATPGWWRYLRFQPLEGAADHVF